MRINGFEVYKALQSRYGKEGAAEVLEKLGVFKGLKNITHNPEVMMFGNAPVRDAKRAAFNPAMSG